MRVLWFANTPCGGAETLGLNPQSGGWLTSLESLLSQSEDIDLHVGFFYKTTHESFRIGKITYHPILKVETFADRLGRIIDNGARSDERDTVLLNEVIERVRPDIIHVHGTEESFILIANTTARPILLSIQGILSPIVEKYFSGIPEALFDKVQGRIAKLLGKSGYRSMARRSERERKMLAQVKWIMGRTDWDRRVSNVLAPSAKYIFGGEILRDPFYANEWKTQNNKAAFVIATIMSGGVFKGFESILKTANIMRNRGIKFEWIVIGQESGSQIVTIAEAAFQMKHQALNVKLVGRKNADEIVDLLLRSDVFCQVSHIENSSNSLCEAMALGMPCIASFAGGTDSLIDNRRDGILIQDGDSYSLAGALLECYESPESARLMGSNARISALARHNQGEIKRQVQSAYLRIIKEDAV